MTDKLLLLSCCAPCSCAVIKKLAEEGTDFAVVFYNPNIRPRAEYEKRHNELWPEMQDMIHEYGGKNYTIFLDRETLVLYGYIEVEDSAKWDESADTAINRKWWDFMADIMETNPDNSPVSVDLHEVFHLD